MFPALIQEPLQAYSPNHCTSVSSCFGKHQAEFQHFSDKVCSISEHCGLVARPCLPSCPEYVLTEEKENKMGVATYWSNGSGWMWLITSRHGHGKPHKHCNTLLVFIQNTTGPDHSSLLVAGYMWCSLTHSVSHRDAGRLSAPPKKHKCPG